MKLELEIWQGLTLLLGFIGVLATAGRLLLTQIDRRLEERFDAQEAARIQATEHWNEKFAAVLELVRRDGDRHAALEREFLQHKADMATFYVRREDYVRGQSVLEAKMDALYDRMDTLRTHRPGGTP